ncbi:hypothetical protein C8R45DRAFT_1218214 [Mycena sanguinolenta]|nr:hypothetical protein C8R45DRAFT_1218214 [Mycena sanguinolenta]
MSAFVSSVVSIAIAISCTTSWSSHAHAIWHRAIAAAGCYEECPPFPPSRRFAAREVTISLLSMLASSSSNRPPLLGEELRENERKSCSVGQSESTVRVGALYFAVPEYISQRWAPTSSFCSARAMFIFPAHGHPFDPHSSSFPFSQCLSPLRLALTLLAILLKAVAVVVETQSAAPSNELKRSSWLTVTLSLETLPSINTLAESLPITLSGPPAPPMRGRCVYRGARGVRFDVSTWRPEAALAAKPRVDAPPIYESETPVSMAKMMMTRHVSDRHFPFSLSLSLPSFLVSVRPIPSLYSCASWSGASRRWTPPFASFALVERRRHATSLWLHPVHPRTPLSSTSLLLSLVALPAATPRGPRARHVTHHPVTFPLPHLPSRPLHIPVPDTHPSADIPRSRQPPAPLAVCPAFITTRARLPTTVSRVRV